MTPSEPVLAARNGVAHAGHHESSEAHRVVATGIRIMDVVLAEIGAEPEGYWGDYLALHGQLVADRINDLWLKVEAKMARAREVFRQRTDGLPEREHIALIARLSAINLEDTFDGSKTAGCPACSRSGWLHGFIHVEWEDEDPEGPPVGHVTFYADGYDCAVCGLRLEGDELELAELQSQIDLPDENPYEAYEPDEDLWSGR